MLKFTQQATNKEPHVEAVASAPVAAISTSTWLALFEHMTPDELRNVGRLVRMVLKPYASTDSDYNDGVISAHFSPAMASQIRQLAHARKVFISDVVREGMGEYLQGHKS